MDAWGGSWGSSWGASWGTNVSSSVGGAGKTRKLRILPDGTRLYATDREVRQILARFYQPKKLETQKRRFAQTPVSVDLIEFDKYIPKVYELKHEFKKAIQADYVAFLETIKRREEEDFLTLILDL